MPARANDQVVELPTPTGGMERRVGSTQVEGGSFRKLENVDFAREVGILATRKGVAPITTTAVPGGDRIRGGTRFYRSNGKDLVVFADDVGGGNGQAFKYVAPNTWTLLGTFPTVGREYHTTSYLDRLYMTNGVDTAKVYDGSTFRDMGPIAPTEYPIVEGAYKIADSMEAFGSGEFEGSVVAANIGDPNEHRGLAIPFSAWNVGEALIIASRSPIAQLRITMSPTALNSNASVASAKFWNPAAGGSWDTLTVQTDGTDVGGKTLAQSGNIDFRTALPWTPPAAWTAIAMSGGRGNMYVMALIFSATLSTPTQAELVEVRDKNDHAFISTPGFESGDKRVYAYSFVRGDKESALSPLTPIMETDGENFFVNIETGGSGVTARKIYRSKEDLQVTTTKGKPEPFNAPRTLGNTDLFLLTTIDNNVDTLFTDRVDDFNLDTVTVPVDNDGPPIAQFITSVHDRVFMARGNTPQTQARLYFSAVSELEFAEGGEQTHLAGPEVFPQDFFIDIGDNNTPITGMSVVLGQLVIFKEDGIYILDGTNPQEFRVIRVHGGVGCIAPRSIVSIDGKLYFLSRNRGRPALYEFAGGFVRPSPGLPMEEFWGENVNGAILEQASAGTHHGMYRITMPSSEAGLSNREYIYDVQLKRWGMNSRIVAGVYIPWTGPGDQGEMYYGSKEEAFVVRVDVGATDRINASAAVEIGGEIEMGFMSFGRPNEIKQVRRIHLMLEVDPAASPVPTYTLERFYDFGANPVVTGTAESDTNVVIDARMDPSGGGGQHSIHHHTVVCGGSAKGDLRDHGYYVKLRLTHTGRIKWHRTAVAFDLFGERARHAN